MTQLATWNVNSLKVRLPQVLEWLAAHQPDVLARRHRRADFNEAAQGIFYQLHILNGNHRISPSWDGVTGGHILGLRP